MFLLYFFQLSGHGLSLTYLGQLFLYVVNDSNATQLMLPHLCQQILRFLLFCAYKSPSSESAKGNERRK
jgi:hypothetical protein